jgi:hypothetical protein
MDEFSFSISRAIFQDMYVVLISPLKNDLSLTLSQSYPSLCSINSCSQLSIFLYNPAGNIECLGMSLAAGFVVSFTQSVRVVFPPDIGSLLLGQAAWKTFPARAAVIESPIEF